MSIVFKSKPALANGSISRALLYIISLQDNYHSYCLEYIKK
jgi:hypothetical protein